MTIQCCHIESRGTVVPNGFQTRLTTTNQSWRVSFVSSKVLSDWTTKHFPVKNNDHLLEHVCPMFKKKNDDAPNSAHLVGQQHLHHGQSVTAGGGVQRRPTTFVPLILEKNQRCQGSSFVCVFGSCVFFLPCTWSPLVCFFVFPISFWVWKILVLFHPVVHRFQSSILGNARLQELLHHIAVVESAGRHDHNARILQHIGPGLGQKMGDQNPQKSFGTSKTPQHFLEMGVVLCFWPQQTWSFAPKKVHFLQSFWAIQNVAAF